VSDDLAALATASGSPDARWTPVSAPALAPPTRAVEVVRAELGATGRSLVLAVGRLAEQKGFDVLAAAADTLADETNAPVIAIAGDGPERERLSRSALLLLGPREDVAELIAAADVVVMPSRWEGWPLVAQEALRAGAALVATPVGGLPQLVGDAAAWVTPPDDPILAAAIRVSEEVVGKKAIFDLSLPGTAPMYEVCASGNVPITSLGGSDDECRAHAPDESFRLDYAAAAVKMTGRFFDAFATLGD